MTDLDDDTRRKLEAVLKPARSVEVSNLADVEPRNSRFLWYPYLPLGKLVIIAGAPGNGKSQLAALIAGMATRGTLYPGDVAEASRVLMMCAEDDLSDTVVPRLLAVNADLRLIDTINVLTSYPDGLTGRGMIKVPGDVGSVHHWVKKHVNARLVVMDPVASFFGREHNALMNQDVRDALGPLIAIAEGYGVTIVIILHLNKSESRDFTARIAESHGFQALARSVMALGPDPDDPEGSRGSKKVLVVTKANLVKPGTYGLRCEVRSVTLPGFTPPIETSELALTGKCDISADDLLMPSIERAERNETMTWLEDFIGEGWVKVNDMNKALTSDGLSPKAVGRRARLAGYQRKKVGYQGQWWIGHPNALARAIPEFIDPLDPLDSFEGPKEDKESKESNIPGDHAREPFDGNGHGNPSDIDLDEFRRFEQRKLGESDEDDG